MPSPEKCRGSVVRQLSLQNPTPLQSPSSRGLKKQLSVDENRVLESVEVTGQGWNVGSDRSQLRVGSGSGKIGQSKVIASRPKPVKLAWSDKKPENSESPAGVEVIATKCQGQPRPASLKTQRMRSPLLGNKDTLVYTRLQLAERLRNAWSEREKIKPNINIFLTRAPDTTRSENNEPATDRPPSMATFQDTASALSDTSAPLDKKRKSMRIRAFSQDLSHTDNYELKNEKFVVPEPAMESSGNEDGLRIINKNSPGSEENEFTGPHLQELSKIEIRVTKVEREAEDQENKPPKIDSEVLTGMKRCRNKISEPFSNGKTEMDSKETSATTVITAQERRANFRRNSILQKTITESFSSGIKEAENKIVSKPPQKKPPLVRAFSAPCQNDQPADVFKAVDLQKKVRTFPQRKPQLAVTFDIPSTNNDDVALLRERMKSAPVRRRLKSAAARRKTKDKDSSDEEKETKDSTATTKKPSRRSQLKKAGDIVTMVSLVSPAASDTEDSVINLPMESWRGEEKEEPPQSGKICPADSDEPKDSSMVVQKFVSLRKSTKSVTFQSHPILNRSYSASFPSRRAPAGTPIIVPTPVISNNPALTPAQLLERDKRAAIFSGLDGRGIKRKFFRSSSESTKDDDVLDGKDSKNVSGSSENLDKICTSKEQEEGEEEKTNGEPDFKCPKERECWNLYQKMVEKGVSVSFDTVLRGMLTPTEYRLRKNHFSHV